MNGGGHEKKIHYGFEDPYTLGSGEEDFPSDSAATQNHGDPQPGPPRRGHAEQAAAGSVRHDPGQADRWVSGLSSDLCLHVSNGSVPVAR